MHLAFILGEGEYLPPFVGEQELTGKPHNLPMVRPPQVYAPEDKYTFLKYAPKKCIYIYIYIYIYTVFDLW